MEKMKKYRVEFNEDNMLIEEFGGFSTRIIAHFDSEKQAYNYIEYMQKKHGDIRCGLYEYNEEKKRYIDKGCIYTPETFINVAMCEILKE